MAGFGFVRDMINSSKSNRGLLKSKGSPYQNFDKSYITDSILSRKPLRFKKADPSYLKKLRIQLKVEKKRVVKKKSLILLFSFGIVLVLGYLIFT